MNTIEFGNATIRVDAIIAVSLWERHEMDSQHSFDDVLVYISGSHFSERFHNSDKDFHEKAKARLDEVKKIWTGK